MDSARLMLEDTIISEITSEDALNLINSKVQINELTIRGADSDGLDFDFSHGLINNIYFSNIGNDALDFSGSRVSVKDFTGEYIGDKAISVGEASSITLKTSAIKNSRFGLVSKDSSELVASGVFLDNISVGLLAYNKKEEFDGGTITFEGTFGDRVDQQAAVESGSSITMNGEKLNISHSKIAEYIY